MDLRAYHDAAMLEALGRDVQVFAGDPDNIKVTRPADLALAGAPVDAISLAALQQNNFRIRAAAVAALVTSFSSDTGSSLRKVSSVYVSLRPVSLPETWSRSTGWKTRTIISRMTSWPDADLKQVRT